jgi:acyl carrier protein
MANETEILQWLKQGKESTQRLIDLKWKITKAEGGYFLESEKVPFTLQLGFLGEELMEIKLDTNIETATMENRDRLGTYRALLILNSQIKKIKFMLEGLSENVVARADIDLPTITKDGLDNSLSLLLSSLYLMVRVLHLEEEFNQQIVERMLMLVKELQAKGKSEKEIVDYLVHDVGFKDEEARKIVSELVHDDMKGNDMLYG